MLELVKLVGISFIVDFSHYLSFPYYYNLVFRHSRILLTDADDIAHAGCEPNEADLVYLAEEVKEDVAFVKETLGL